MEINKDLVLTSNNYHINVHKKTQIVIGNTLSLDMGHFDLWKNKMNGNFKGTAPYTVMLNGKVYEHYDPKFYSDSINIDTYDTQIIPIVLENEGWLMKDFRNNKYLTWCGDIYDREDPIEIKWRGNMRWAPYSDTQIDSLVELCNDLIERFNINRYVSDHNTKIIDVGNLRGIYYRSNFTTTYLDVSPAFNFSKFKEKVENHS